MDFSFPRMMVSNCYPSSAQKVKFGRLFVGLLLSFAITGCTTVLPRLPNNGAFCPWGDPVPLGYRDFNYGVYHIVTVDLSPSVTGREITAHVTMSAAHSVHGIPRIFREWDVIVYTLPPGSVGRIASISPASGRAEGFTPRAGGEFLHCNDGEVYSGPGLLAVSGVIERIEVIGDTGGDDISNDPNCGCDTQIKSMGLSRVNLTMER